MKLSRIGLSALLTVALLLMMAFPASAVTAAVTSRGTFSGATGDGAAGVTICGPQPSCSSQPASQIRWGQPTGSQRSGLGFAGTANQTISSSDPFAVGTLIHFNSGTVSGTGIDGVVLTVDVTVTTSAGSFGLSVPVQLQIDETPNQSPCAHPSDTPCADAINIVSLGENLSATEVLGDTSFTLTVSGFMRAGQLVTQFVSQENRTNSVQLFATLEQNNRPAADAGADRTVEQTGSSTSVTLDGSGSSDPDGDDLTYTWSGPALSAEATGHNPTVGLPAGTHEIVLTVSDGVLSDTDTVQIVVQDTVAPGIAGSRMPAANGDGWNNSEVTVTFECTDAGSGIASCTPDSTLSAEGTGQSVTGQAVDNAGNSASAVVGGINIDKTAPTVTFSGNAGSYSIGQTVQITCSATDALSGLASATCPEVSGAAIDLGPGTHTLEATATDRAGNTTVETATFEITVTYDGLCELARSYSGNPGVANSLCAKLASAQASAERGQTDSAAGMIAAFKNEVAAQSGKALTAQQAATLSSLADTL